MKKISIIILTLILSLLLLTNNAYAVTDGLANDPGNTKWGLYHEQTTINSTSVYGVNLRTHIGSTYYNYNTSTGLKFGTIKNYVQGVTNGTYQGYDNPNASYAGEDGEGEYIFNITAPNGYSELVIDSRTTTGSSWVTRYTGQVSDLEVLSFWDGLFFRSNNSTLYSSTMKQMSGYQESNELFRIYFRPHASDTQTPDPEEPSETVIVTDFNTLPVTSGYLSDAKQINKVGWVYFTYYAGNQYTVKIHYGGIEYLLGVMTLPGVDELGKEPLSPGIYYTENNKRLIYYEFQLPASERPLNEQVTVFVDEASKINGFRPFVSMNLTDSEYAFTDKLKLYAGFHDGGQGKAFADVLFPMDLDELLAIEMDYQYRWKILWGASYSPWQTVNVQRYMGEVVSMKSTWQHVVESVVSSYNVINNVVSSFGDTIKRLDDLTTTYKNTYLGVINNAQYERGEPELTMNELFLPEYSMYRVYLNTYNDGRYTGYEIHDDIVILNVTYQYHGEIYHVPYEDIDTISGGGSSEDPIEDVIGDFGKNWQSLIDTFTNVFAFVNTHWSTIVIVVIVIASIIAILIVLYFVSSLVNSTKAVTSSMQKAFGPSPYSYKSRKQYKKSGSGGLVIIILVLVVAVFFIAKGLRWF